MAKSVNKKVNLYKTIKTKNGKKRVKIGTKTTNTNTAKGSNLGLTSDKAKLKALEIKAQKDVKLMKQANLSSFGLAGLSKIGNNYNGNNYQLFSSSNNQQDQLVNGGIVQSGNRRDDDDGGTDPGVFG